MKCRCDETDTIRHNDVADFTAEHLEIVKRDRDSWTTEYVCSVCGTRWLKDFEYPEMQGGGFPRLRKLPAAGDGA
jgi:hypothetical protein